MMCKVCHGDVSGDTLLLVCHGDVSGDTFYSDVAGDAAFVNNAAPLSTVNPAEGPDFLFSFSWII
jgi:hypothetical protein